MGPATVVILAAGQGTRMRSATPKVLHPLCGRPLVAWPAQAALDAGVRRVVVVGGPDRALEGALPEGVALAVQQEPRGTGDAVASAGDEIDRDAPVIVLAGDVPLVTSELIAALADFHAGDGAAVTIATMELDDPRGYGRVVRGPDGSVERVVETKEPGDASAAELAIREVNTGIFAFDGGKLLDALARVRPDNVQGEIYLPDALRVLHGDGEAVAAYTVEDPALTLGINDRVDLARVRAAAQRRICERHMRAGVTIVAPEATTIDVGVEIGRDTTIEPGTALRGTTHVGAGCAIGPHATLIDARVGDEAIVIHSHLVDCELATAASVGPFAYLRPGAMIGAGAKVGTFVEVKNSDIGAGAKVPHLSYVGDADVGERSNLGAGTITANYDGRTKHRTTIGADVRGGVHTSFVAPVRVGDGAYTAAGSTITNDVPADSLGVGRARQRNVDGWAKRKQS